MTAPSASQTNQAWRGTSSLLKTIDSFPKEIFKNLDKKRKFNEFQNFLKNIQNRFINVHFYSIYESIDYNLYINQKHSINFIFVHHVNIVVLKFPRNHILPNQPAIWNPKTVEIRSLFIHSYSIYLVFLKVCRCLCHIVDVFSSLSRLWSSSYKFGTAWTSILSSTCFSRWPDSLGCMTFPWRYPGISSRMWTQTYLPDPFLRSCLAQVYLSSSSNLVIYVLPAPSPGTWVETWSSSDHDWLLEEHPWRETHSSRSRFSTWRWRFSHSSFQTQCTPGSCQSSCLWIKLLFGGTWSFPSAGHSHFWGIEIVFHSWERKDH